MSLLVLFVTASACDNTPSAKAGGTPGTVYGKGVTAAASVPISKLLAEADAYDGKPVRVEGTITDVCPMRGCWIDIAGDKEFESVRFKVEDGVMTFPLDAKGKYVVAEGVARKVTPNPEAPAAGCDGEHGKGAGEHAGHGEAAGSGAAHDCGAAPGQKVAVRLDGTGAVVRDRR
jgi:hypothetical protein